MWKQSDSIFLNLFYFTQLLLLCFLLFSLGSNFKVLFILSTYLCFFLQKMDKNYQQNPFFTFQYASAN